MESLDDIMKKRKGWTVMLKLLTPYVAPENAHMMQPAQELWFTLSLQRERQVYVTLWEQKLRGIGIKNHPYYAIKDCVPIPFNWNGTDHLQSMMKNFKMVRARYFNGYGIYTVQAAEAFQLTEQKPLNFKPLKN